MPVYSNGSSSINFTDDQYSQIQAMANQTGMNVEDLLSKAAGFQGVISGVGKSSSDTQSPLGQMAEEYGIPYTSANSDMFLEHFFNEQSAERSWERTKEAAQNSIRWQVNDLKAAGLNPFLAMSGISGSSPSAPVASTSGGSITSRKNNQATNEAGLMKTIITAVASIIGLALFKFGKL